MLNQDEKPYQRRRAERETEAKDRYAKGWRRYFRWWKTPSDRFAFFLVVATIVLAAATVFLVSVGFFQYQILEKTDRTLKAEQRPWVSLGSPKPASDFQYGDSGAFFSVEFGLKNSGHSPALNVEIDAEMPLMKSHMNLRRRQDEICDRLRTRPIGSVGGGFTIFPNEPSLPLTFQFSISRQEIDDVLKINKLPVPIINPVIIGCLRYVFYVDFSQHDTGFLYDVMHVPPFGLIRTDQGNVPKDSILLVIPNFGSGRTN